VLSPTIIFVEAYLGIHRIYVFTDIISQYTQFFTTTIFEIKHLWKPYKYKQIIVDSLQFLVKDYGIFLFTFCGHSSGYGDFRVFHGFHSIRVFGGENTNKGEGFF
jgi:hypothetical protein